MKSNTVTLIILGVILAHLYLIHSNILKIISLFTECARYAKEEKVYLTNFTKGQYHESKND